MPELPDEVKRKIDGLGKKTKKIPYRVPKVKKVVKPKKILEDEENCDQQKREEHLK